MPRTTCPSSQRACAAEAHVGEPASNWLWQQWLCEGPQLPWKRSKGNSDRRVNNLVPSTARPRGLSTLSTCAGRGCTFLLCLMHAGRLHPTRSDQLLTPASLQRGEAGRPGQLLVLSRQMETLMPSRTRNVLENTNPAYSFKFRSCGNLRTT